MNLGIEFVAIFLAVIILRVFIKPGHKQAAIKTSYEATNLPPPVIDYQKSFDNLAPKSRVKQLGKLHLPSGSIVACDGIVYNDTEPFTKKVKPGQYEVDVLIINTGTDERPNERIALARLTFSDKPAVKWEMAVVGAGPTYFYGVDAGVGSFMDEQTHKDYDEFARKLYEQKPGANLYDDFLADIFKQNAEGNDKDGQWANVSFPGTKNNVIMFSSGWGDGAYATYWGYSADGDVACLVTDFQVIEA